MNAKPIVEVTFDLSVEPEDLDVRGSFDTGDKAQDTAFENEILARIDYGDPWAWACVTMTARIEIDGEVFIGTDTLGGCSYRDEDDFKADGYYQDMLDNARKDLIANIESCYSRAMIARKALKIVRG